MNILLPLAFSLIACFLVVILRQHRPEFALLAAAAAAAVVLVYIIGALAPYFSEFLDMMNNAGIKSEYFFAVLKAVGICYITRFCADLCRDFGQTSLADKAELAGRTALIVLSLPFLKSIIELSVSLIK